MKHGRLFLLIILVLCLSAGCARKAEPQRKVDVYYCAADGGLESGSALVRYTALVGTDADLLHEALNLLHEVPPEAEGVKSALNGLHIDAYTLEEGDLKITLSTGYKALSPVDKTLARSCLILTLCGLEEVDTMSILEDNVVLESGLTRAILLPDSLPEGTGVVETCLWTPDVSGNCLNGRMIQVDLSVWMNPAEGIMDELLNDLSVQHCLKNVVALRSMTVDKGVCTLDFKDGFLSAEPFSAVSERLFVYSLVNSLTERSDINRVRFLSEGKPIGCWLNMDFSSEFVRESAFTETEMYASENSVLTLYLGNGQGDLVPIKIGATVSSDREERIYQAAAALLELKDTWGYRRLIPASTTLSGVELNGSTCVLHLSEDFHHSMDGEDIAAAALVNTLIDSCGLTGVSIYTESGAYQEGKILKKDWAIIVD